MNEGERLKMIDQCRYVDEAYISPPFFPTIEFVNSLKKTDLVTHDSLPYNPQKYKVILNIDSSTRFDPNFNFSNLISTAIKQNSTDVTLLASNSHNIFSATHPKMFECFQHINKKSTIKSTQYKSDLILWIGSEIGWKIMKRFIKCSLHPECMGLPGSTMNYLDQSALNLILLEEAKYRPSLFQIESNAFKIRKDSKLK